MSQFEFALVKAAEIQRLEGSGTPPEKTSPQGADSTNSANGAKVDRMDKGTGAPTPISRAIRAVGAWAFRRWTPIRWIVTGLAGLMFVPVISRWLEAFGEQNHWFENPNAQVGFVMTWLSGLASDPWFLWISGALVGVAIGLWLDTVVRRFAPAKVMPTLQPSPPALSRDDQAINGRIAWSAILEMQREIRGTLIIAERSYEKKEPYLTRRFAPVRPRLEALLAKVAQAGISTPAFARYDWGEISLLQIFLNEIEPFFEQQVYDLAKTRARAMTAQIDEELSKRKSPTDQQV